jgi:hypothetical protein
MTLGVRDDFADLDAIDRYGDGASASEHMAESSRPPKPAPRMTILLLIERA